MKMFFLQRGKTWQPCEVHQTLPLRHQGGMRTKLALFGQVEKRSSKLLDFRRQKHAEALSGAQKMGDIMRYPKMAMRMIVNGYNDDP